MINNKIKLFYKLFKEAGIKYILYFLILSFLARIFEVFSISIFFSLFLIDTLRFNLSFFSELSIVKTSFLLGFIILLRSVILGFVRVKREKLRNNFTNKLRTELLKNILLCNSSGLLKIERNELKNSLNNYIDKTGIAFDLSFRIIESLLAFLVYLLGLIYFSDNNKLPFFIGVISTCLVSIFWKFDSWGLALKKLELNKFISKTLSEGMLGIKTLKASNAQNWLFSKFDDNTFRYLEVQNETLKREVRFSIFKDLFIFGFILIWIVNSTYVFERNQILLLLLLSYKASTFIGNIISSYRLSLANLTAYLELDKVRQIIGLKNQFIEKTKQDKINAFPLFSRFQDNEIERFYWKFKGDYNFPLKEISLMKGDICIIKGLSGSGKSTLLDIFSGNFQEEYSEWKISFRNNKEYIYGYPNGTKDLKDILSYCPQTPFLFECSLLENLLFDDLKLENNIKKYEKEIKYYFLETGMIKRFDYLSLRKNMNLTLDNFSGGEKKRISLIRTWLRDCKIEILDEPTESLDLKSAGKVIDIIKKRSKDRIIIVATHNKLLIDNATQIIDLDYIHKDKIISLYKSGY